MIAKINTTPAVPDNTLRYPVLLTLPKREEKKNMVVLFMNEFEGYRIVDNVMSAELETWIPATDGYWRRFSGTVTLSNP